MPYRRLQILLLHPIAVPLMLLLLKMVVQTVVSSVPLLEVTVETDVKSLTLATAIACCYSVPHVFSTACGIGTGAGTGIADDPVGEQR